MPDLPGEPFVDRGGSIRKGWLDWIVGTIGRLFTTGVTQVADSVALVDQTATIGATAFGTGTLQNGRYLVTLYGRLTTAAGTSSSLQLHLTYTDPDDNQVLVYNSPALTSNLVTDVIQVTVPVDAGVAVSYGASYASVGVPAAVFKLSATILELPR